MVKPLTRYTFIGTHEQMNTIFAALGEIAHKFASPVATAMLEQFKQQENEAASQQNADNAE